MWFAAKRFFLLALGSLGSLEYAHQPSSLLDFKKPFAVSSLSELSSHLSFFGVALGEIMVRPGAAEMEMRVFHSTPTVWLMDARWPPCRAMLRPITLTSRHARLSGDWRPSRVSTEQAKILRKVPAPVRFNVAGEHRMLGWNLGQRMNAPSVLPTERPRGTHDTCQVFQE